MTDPQKLADQLPGPAQMAQRCGDDTQAFAERMTVVYQSDLSDLVTFAQQGHYGMALYVAQQLMKIAGNRAAGSVVLTNREQLLTAVRAMRTAFEEILAALSPLAVPSQEANP